MKNLQNLPVITAVAAILVCVAIAPLASVSAAPANRERLPQRAPEARGTVLVQSANDEGACYTWNRINPYQEMCNQSTRGICESANSVFVGSRFVENGVCPDNS
jgi:hypothetical protein